MTVLEGYPPHQGEKNPEPYRQFEVTLPPNKISSLRVIALWLIPRDSPVKPITTHEEKIARQLSPLRSIQFRHSRGYARHHLAQLFKIAPLDIPLIASPGEPPKLPNGWGYLSFSYCCDSFLVGWSSLRLGVDLERSDRSFHAAKLAKRHFFKLELDSLANLNKAELRSAVLDKWLAKEAAIKWQNGSLGEDLSNWYYDFTSSSVVNKVLKKKLRLQKINHLNWRIVTVSEIDESKGYYSILCLT